ncbi:MAG: NAD(P)H-hydrate dehydratase [Chloroflexi bacterium]|nr:NAD(P)H-hydrate dehydratase [Chloroflexota bacterium]
MKLVTSAEMKEIEGQSEDAGVTTTELMLNAGVSVYEAIVLQPKFDPDNKENELTDGLVLVLAGSGNNGGDAMVVAALLEKTFPEAEIKIYFHKRPRPEDPLGFPEKLTYTEAEEQDGQDLAEPIASQAFELDLTEAALVVDGLLGAGLSREVAGDLAQIIDTINKARTQRQYNPTPLFVAAIDVPSGLSTDTGAVLGTAIQADLTVTLGLPKRGLYQYQAAAYTGRIVLGDIGLPKSLLTEVAERAEKEKSPALITAEWVRCHLPLRPLTGHKGTFGKLMVLSGAKEYLGAPYLCTSAAMRSGAGLVTLAAPQSAINVVATKMSENTYLVLPEIESLEIAVQAADLLATKIKEGSYTAVLIGPGLGNDASKLALIERLIEKATAGFKYPKMVIDADGLNLLTQIPNWFKKLPSGNILTPHPGELATLRHTSIREIEQDRFKAAQEAAQEFNQVVVLKGAYTVVAAPDGRLLLNPAANPAMGTAGSGDVLAGIAAGLLTQLAKAKDTLDAFEVASLAVYLHSMAGELVSRDYGTSGPLAGDFLQAIPQAIKAIKNGDSLE